MYEKQVSVINAAGGTMTFQAFNDACHSAKTNASVWIRAKHDGVLTTYIENGVLMISTAVPGKVVKNG